MAFRVQRLGFRVHLPFCFQRGRSREGWQSARARTCLTWPLGEESAWALEYYKGVLTGTRRKLCYVLLWIEPQKSWWVKDDLCWDSLSFDLWAPRQSCCSRWLLLKIGLGQPPTLNCMVRHRGFLRSGSGTVVVVTSTSSQLKSLFEKTLT